MTADIIPIERAKTKKCERCKGTRGPFGIAYQYLGREVAFHGKCWEPGDQDWAWAILGVVCAT